MNKLLTIAVMLIVCLSSAPIGCGQTVIKWGRHKKQQPLYIPDAPFPIVDMAKEARVHKYLNKKRTDLLTDLKTYPGLKDEIQTVLDDIDVLEHMSVSDADFPEKFAQFHATLAFVWAMEGYQTA